MHVCIADCTKAMPRSGCRQRARGPSLRAHGLRHSEGGPGPWGRPEASPRCSAAEPTGPPVAMAAGEGRENFRDGVVDMMSWVTGGPTNASGTRHEMERARARGLYNQSGLGLRSGGQHPHAALTCFAHNRSVAVSAFPLRSPQRESNACFSLAVLDGASTGYWPAAGPSEDPRVGGFASLSACVRCGRLWKIIHEHPKPAGFVSSSWGPSSGSPRPKAVRCVCLARGLLR